MRVQIQINGISTSSSYKDGDCLVLSNLRKKNGVLKPVTPRKIIKTLKKKYTYIFVHQLPSTGENYICVRDSAVYYVANGGLSTETKLADVSGFKSITQIGNILNILDENGLQYVIWYESEYKLINTNFDGAQTNTELFCKVDLKVDGFNDAGDRTITHHYTDDETLWYNNDADVLNMRKKLAASLFLKGIAYNNSKGRSTGYFMACTAFELYDGSYILHSNPVLMGMPYDNYARYEGLVVDGITYDHKTNPAKYYPLIGNYQEVTSNADNEYELSKNEIHAGTAGTSGNNELTDKFGDICATYYLKIDGGSTSKRMTAILSSNSLKVKINSAISDDYKQLVKSICVFITPQISLYDLTKDARYIGYFDYNTTSAAYCENYIPEIKEISDIIKELELLNFYKVKTIDFDDIVAGTWIDLTDDLKGKLGDNLVNQELLPVDNSTHHSLIPQKQYIYNSRLHAMDYKTVLSHGFPFNYFLPNQGTGQFAATENPNSLTNCTNYRNYVEVLIKTAEGTTKVVRHTAASLVLSDLMPMISYPDSRATKITFYWYALFTVPNPDVGIYNKMSFALKASDIGNFAYYISPDLKPILFNTNTAGTAETVPTELNRELIYRNGMKASALNNPFTFPAINTYQIGTGVIRWARTNAKQVSEGQFGLYPLYIGTTEGVVALSVGTGEVLYQTQTPANNVKPISDIACQTDYGVVYIGKKGLYMLYSPEPTFISGQVEEERTQITGISAELNISFPVNFNDIQIIDMLFDSKNNELIILSDGDNYVFNFDSKEIYTTTEKIEKAVQNIYPELYITQTEKGQVRPGQLTPEWTNIKDVSQEGNNKQTVTIVTRPFNFGTNDKKTIERTILRATIWNAHNLKAAIFRSFDGVLFNFVQGIVLQEKTEGNIKGIDLGLLQIKSNQFIYVLKGEMETESKISSLDVEVRDDLSNTKLR